MRKFYRINGLLLAVLLLLSFSGCSEKVVKTKAYGSDYKEENADDGIIAENERFSLSFDAELCNLILTDKTSDAVWSTTPYDFYSRNDEDKDKKIQTLVAAPLNIDYIEPEDLSVKTVRGYTGAVKDGKTTSRIIKNGIEITYYFESIKVSVPIDYVLREDSLAISIDTSRITEDIYKIFRITVAPFLCSVQNAAEDSYVFVPSGCGALMTTDVVHSGTKVFSEEVYGADAARKIIEKTTNTEPVRLPVFGIREGNKAMCCIVEENAESAVIEANAGNQQTGYSNACVSFMLRGYDMIENKTSHTVARQFSTNFAQDRILTVGYYPLAGEKADYSGMAETYRNYLFAGEKAEKENSFLGLNILGGVKTRAFFLGIPYNTLKAVTTFEQAEQIISTLSEQIDLPLAVRLYGFGESGMDAGEVGGGFRFGKVFGGAEQYQSLQSYCTKNSIALYTDFDLVQYQESGGGFSGLFDSSRTASHQVSYQYTWSKALGNIDDSYEKYKLLSRARIQTAADKLLEAVNKQKIRAVSLDSLSTLCYSDFGNTDYYTKGGMAAEVSDIILRLKESGAQVAVGSANAYAAAVSSAAFGVPLLSSEYDTFAADVPFYEMVFKGHITLFSTAVNCTADAQQMILRAAETGTGLSFTLISNYDTSLVGSRYTDFYGASFENNRELICNAAQQMSDLYRAVSGAEILHNSDYKTPQVRKTVFSNGVAVYVNYSDKAAETPAGVLQPRSFSFTEEEV